MTFLPVVLKITDDNVVRKEVSIERFLIPISKITVSNPKKILIVALALIVFGAYAGTQVKLETDRMKYFLQDLPADMLT